MPPTRGDVRYHVPRDRSPVPAVLVGALVVVTLVSAQLSIAGEQDRTARGTPAAASTDGTTGAAPSDAPSGSPSGGSSGTSGSPSAAAPTEDGLPQPVEVTFPVGSDAPAGDADALLGPVVAALLADPGTRVRVTGHAEPSNDPVLEEQLSLRRAETVLDLLRARGMPTARADLVAAGATEAGGSLSGTDRRVTVEVVRG